MHKPNYLPPKCKYVLERDGSIQTDLTFVKKITGTSLGAILGVSPYMSPFRAACAMLGLAVEDISDKPAVKAGHVLEPKIVEYANQAYSNTARWIPAEEVFEKREGDHDRWPSDFDDEIFAGHVDGIAVESDGMPCILEVKTTSNIGAWERGPPEYYMWQVRLYSYFVYPEQDHVYFLLGVLDQEQQKNPETWVPSTDNCGVFRVELDETETLMGLARAREWYNQYILNGRTPPYDPTDPKDVQLHEHLRNLTSDADEMSAYLDELAEVRRRLEQKDIEMKEDILREEELNNKIKTYMIAHGCDSIPSKTGTWKGIITRNVRKSIDPQTLRDAGIDPEPYTTKKVVETFRIKENK